MRVTQEEHGRRTFSESKLLNFVGFQAVWWLSILLGYLSMPLVACLLWLHLRFHSQPRVEAKVIFLCASLGYLVDLALGIAGLYEFEGHLIGRFLAEGIAPFWLFFLWLGFAATLRVSFSFLRKKLLIAGVVAAISGPSSYLAAQALGVVSFPLGNVLTMALLALIWMVLFPALLLISQRVELNS